MDLQQQNEHIDKIMNSANELISLIDENITLDSKIRNAIDQILDCIDNILKLVPDMLIIGEKDRISKKEIVVLYRDALNEWNKDNFAESEFLPKWKYFFVNWRKFKKNVEQTGGKEKTIYISLN